MIHVNKIIEHFENHFDYDFEKHKDVIELNQCTKITNLKTFLSSHILILKANSGNSVYMPYYDRLYKVYLISKI
jgi:hypothetical protein